MMNSASTVGVSAAQRATIEKFNTKGLAGAVTDPSAETPAPKRTRSLEARRKQGESMARVWAAKRGAA